MARRLCGTQQVRTMESAQTDWTSWIRLAEVDNSRLYFMSSAMNFLYVHVFAAYGSQMHAWGGSDVIPVTTARSATFVDFAVKWRLSPWMRLVLQLCSINSVAGVQRVFQTKFHMNPAFWNQIQELDNRFQDIGCSRVWGKGGDVYDWRIPAQKQSVMSGGPRCGLSILNMQLPDRWTSTAPTFS